jgi:hypothetical protein
MSSRERFMAALNDAIAEYRHSVDSSYLEIIATLLDVAADMVERVDEGLLP